MSEHDLEDKVEYLEHRTWRSVIINQRVMTIRDHFYCLNSNMTWKTKPNSKMTLFSEFALQGTLFSMQKWHVQPHEDDDCTTVICLRPLPGSCNVDLLGFGRSKHKKLTKNADEYNKVDTDQPAKAAFIACNS